jgi:hypothetical protein
MTGNNLNNTEYKHSVPTAQKTLGLQYKDLLVNIWGNSLCLQLLNFWTLSIVLFFLFKTQRFGDWILSPSSGKSLLSWAQSIELPFPWTATLTCWEGLVPLRREEGRPKAVRDKVAGKGLQQYS